MGRVFSTGKFDMIRVSQYLIDGLKGGCKGNEYSKSLKKPFSSSTGMTSETLIYHNACSKENLLLITPVLEEEKRIDLRFDCLVTDGFLSLS